MKQKSALRIDTAIKPSSCLRMMLYSSLASTVILLAWFAGLLLWQYVLILVISASVVSYLVLTRPIVLHMSQPPINQRIDENWQLLVRTSRNDELWQAKLNTVHHYQALINFEFIIIEPYQRSLSVTVFRDQVSVDDWRNLNILANIISPQTT